MSASVMAEDRQRCLDAGMNDFVAKPFEPEALCTVLLRWTGPRGPRAAQPRRPAGPGAGPHGPGSW
jgi:CheY-like chemotaxis protein